MNSTTQSKPAPPAPARVSDKPRPPDQPQPTSPANPIAAPPAKRPSTSRLTREARIALTIAAVVVVATSVTIAYYFHTPAAPTAAVIPPPRVDDSIAAVAAYVAAEPFSKLPFDRQRRYMELLDDREAELKQAYAEAKLDATVYRRALEYAWFGKQLPRMDKFHTLPASKRDAYVSERLDKKGKGKKKGSGGGGANVGTTPIAEAAATDKVTRDEQSEKDIPKTWPAEWQDKWKQYRAAMKDQREARDEAAEDAEAAVTQTAPQ